MPDVTLDLRLKPAQRVAIAEALTTMEALLDAPKFQRVIEAWPDLPLRVKEELLERCPLFARFIALARRIRSY